jgi:hypothetical protein
MDIVSQLVSSNIDSHEFCVDTFHANRIHEVISTVNKAIYGKHGDGNPTLFRDDDAAQTPMADGYRLPTQTSLQVPTVIIQNQNINTTHTNPVVPGQGGTALPGTARQRLARTNAWLQCIWIAA